MMCSTRELELGDDHDGIIELPADAPIGTPFADYAGLNDPVIDVAITPNRQDCMGVRGIARDLAAAGLGTLKPLAEVYRATSLDPVAGEGPGPDVRTDDPEGCPAFYAQGVSRRDQRRLARMDAPHAHRDRAEADLGAGRHHQFRLGRSRPAAARLRQGQARRAGSSRARRRTASRCSRSTARPIRSTRR